jgi:hypothetical protein
LNWPIVEIEYVSFAFLDLPKTYVSSTKTTVWALLEHCPVKERLFYFAGG